MPLEVAGHNGNIVTADHGAGRHDEATRLQLLLALPYEQFECLVNEAKTHADGLAKLADELTSVAKERFSNKL